MKSQQWMLEEIKKLDTDIQQHKQSEEEQKKIKSKKYERVFTQYELLDALVHGIYLGQKQSLHTILEDEHWRLQKEQNAREEAMEKGEQRNGEFRFQSKYEILERR